jgi:hypothetical protein
MAVLHAVWPGQRLRPCKAGLLRRLRSSIRQPDLCLLRGLLIEVWINLIW